MPANDGVSADYNEANGPSLGNTVSLRGLRMPADMKRSRRVGLSRDVCSECGGVKHEQSTRHERYCSVPGTRIRQRTGPLHTTQRPFDYEWRPAVGLHAVSRGSVLAAA